ncbi:cellulose biosynthesis cyclic di-GMP-binding regulatory protein BcsB [Rhizobium sp. LjRoot30]|uniref:cellulose biosynthesis cyclic di-GMP-binding regulatory protein BcsB n=1 Tax=Rhizobium sp. LjRoot30 TaxID=3342320 RepID=UPI003ECFAA0C
MHDETMVRRLALALVFAATGLMASTALAGEFRLLPAARQETPVVEKTEKADASLLPTAVAPAQLVAAASSSLIPFAQAADRLQLTGEDDTAVLSFHLAATQLAAGGKLQIGYQNAVSVLPDTGVLDVTVNGKAAGAIAIRSPNGVKTETLALPADALQAGRNEVRLRARQHHRVDCSLNATYELWTKIDPAASGFLPVKPVGFTALEDLLSVGKTAGGKTEIRLVADGAASVALANEGIAAVQALALFLDREDLVVTVGKDTASGPGIDLFVGSGAEAGQTAEGKRLLSGSASGLSVQPGRVPGRAVVLLSGATAGERTASLLAAVRGPMRAGLDGSLFAGTWGRIAAEPSKSYTLRDAGYVTAPFVGRLSRTRFELQMPADFYPAEYATIDFHLRGATAPGLALGAQLLVRVNDKVVTSLPFRNADGEQFNGKRIELPLRAFRPGVNRVEVMAEVPVAADAACAPQVAAEATPRFILLETSSLDIPALARIGHFPDLGALAGAAYPFGDGKPFDVFIDSADPRVLGAALTTVARLGVAAARPLSAKILLSQPVEAEGRNALVISAGGPAVAAIPDKADTASDAADLMAGFAVKTPEDTDPVTTAALDATAPDAKGDDTQALLDAFRNSTVAPETGGSFATQAETWTTSMFSRFRRWLRYEDPAGAEASNETGALVTLSQVVSPSGLGNWTVIRSDSLDHLALGMQTLAATSAWQRLEGGSAWVRGEDGVLVSRAATTRIITEITDLSFGNFRRLAASWFSDNFQIYIALVIVLMSGFGAWLGFAVSKKGVRTDQ